MQMVRVTEHNHQKRITLRAGLCEAMDIRAEDEVTISFRPDLGLWVFSKVITSSERV